MVFEVPPIQQQNVHVAMKLPVLKPIVQKMHDATFEIRQRASAISPAS